VAAAVAGPRDLLCTDGTDLDKMPNDAVAPIGVDDLLDQFSRKGPDGHELTEEELEAAEEEDDENDDNDGEGGGGGWTKCQMTRSLRSGWTICSTSSPDAATLIGHSASTAASGELVEQIVHPDRSDRVIWHFVQVSPVSAQQVGSRHLLPRPPRVPPRSTRARPALCEPT
jgi:hypothetical protein